MQLQRRPGDPYRSRSSLLARYRTFVLFALVLVSLPALYWLLRTPSREDLPGIIKTLNKEFQPLSANPLVSRPGSGIVIVDEADIELATSPLRRLHYVRGGGGRLAIFLIHGGLEDERAHQSGRHWSPHFHVLEHLGSFFSVDMLGFGKSEPHTQEQHRISMKEQEQALMLLVDQATLDNSDPVVLIARSWGARVALMAASRLESRLRGLVFVAPDIGPADMAELPAFMRSTPLLLVWAKDDPVASYATKADLLESNFGAVTPLLYDEILMPGMSPPVAHLPEDLRPLEFQSAVREFITRLYESGL